MTFFNKSCRVIDIDIDIVNLRERSDDKLLNIRAQ